MVSFELLTKWTNLKSTLAGADKGGTYYTDCVPFSVEEIREHVGLYVFHGLSPSPRIELKFRSQHQDKVHGNDFIHRSFGPNSERRHKHFKAFFHVKTLTLILLIVQSIPTGRWFLCSCGWISYLPPFGYLVYVFQLTRLLWDSKVSTKINSE